MAKNHDPFDKFREATLGGANSLRGALAVKETPAPAKRDQAAPLSKAVVSAAAATAEGKVSKNANRRLVSFHIDKGVFLKLGQLKFETGAKYDELYNEAVYDLLKKYGRI